MESVKDTILTIKQAAQRSRVNRARIDAAIAGGELRFMKLSTGTRRIWAYDLEASWTNGGSRRTVTEERMDNEFTADQ